MIRPKRNPTARREPSGEDALAAVVLLSGLAGFVICGAAWWQGRAASATTTPDAAPVLVTGTAASPLVPGASTEVAFVVDNPSPAPVRVRVVELVAITVDHGHAACATKDFSVPPVSVDETVAPGASAQPLGAKGTLRFADTGRDQNACQGAALSLYFAAR